MADFEIVPFKAHHLEPFLHWPQFDYIRKDMTKERMHAHELSGTSFTALFKKNVVAMGGITRLWDGVGEAWAMFIPGNRPLFLKIHNAVKKYLDVCGLHRVQMTVDYNFNNGHRWARLLGFRLEAGRLQKYTSDKRDVSIYALVRE